MAQYVTYSAHGLVPPRNRPPIPGGMPQTVAAVLDRWVRETPDAEALVGRDARYTYAALDEAANRAAAALAALGVRTGTRVAASLPNRTDIVVAFLGAMRLGAIWVGINRPLAAPEKAYMIEDAQASVFLGDAEAVRQIEEASGRLPALQHIVRVGEERAESPWHGMLAKVPHHGRPIQEIDPFAPAAIAYTSGTTGFPKGAVHSQHNLLLPGAVDAIEGIFGPGHRQGVLLPLSILNLMVLVPLGAFQAGGCAVVMDRLDAAGVAEWVRAERVEHFAAVPAIYHDLLTRPEVDLEDLEALTRPQVGGADCPEAFLNLYREKCGREVITTYGMTEAPTCVTRSDPREPAVPGASGRRMPQLSVHILDDQDRDLPPGEVGEVCYGPAVEGRWAGVYTPMLGYWNRPEATAKTLRGGLLHSGDVGYLDDAGNLFVKARIKDLILRGGANVYPAEVERVLHEDDRVAACAVLGKPHPRLGEDVIALVQLAPGARATAEELLAHCAERLAKYKVPREIRFVDQFPRNSMGKILKRELRAALEA